MKPDDKRALLQAYCDALEDLYDAIRNSPTLSGTSPPVTTTWIDEGLAGPIQQREEEVARTREAWWSALGPIPDDLPDWPPPKPHTSEHHHGSAKTRRAR